MEAINTDILQSLGLSSQNQGAQRARDGSDLGINEFMSLMLAQIKNQDPFEPMQNGDFIAQMASFGTVSGIDHLRDSFSSFSESMMANQALQAAGMVGRFVQIESDVASLRPNQPVTGVIDLPQSTGLLRLNIYNQQGTLVRSIGMGSHAKGLVDFSWDGRDSEGQTVNPGEYRISAEAMHDGTTSAVPTLLNAKVGSVTLGDHYNQIQLNLESGNSVSFNTVRQIR